MNNIANNFDLGIIGGAGPLIATKFSHDLLKAWQQQTSAQADSDFPSLLIWNKPWDGIDGTGVNDDRKAEQHLQQAIKKICELEVKRFIVPCLSAYDLDVIQHPNSINLMGWLTSKLKHQTVDNITLLTSESTKKQRKIEKRLRGEGFIVRTTNDKQQTLVNLLIRQGMTGRITEYHQQLAQQLEDELKTNDGIIWWGCTELSFISSEVLSERSIQTIPIMVETCLEVLLNDRKLIASESPR